MGKSAAANWAGRWARGTVPNRANNPKRQGIVQQTVQNAKDYRKPAPQVDHRENPELRKAAQQTFF